MTMTVAQEREAEMTLLLLLENMSMEDRVPFLQEVGVSRAEFERIYEKYHHLMERYRKEKENPNA